MRTIARCSCRISCTDGAEIKYSTVQNWYPGNKEGKGVYNFVTKRGLCRNQCKNLLDTSNRICCDLEISFMYPKETIHSVGYSIAVTNNFQQADTGTK
jgi:Fe-S cluster assembly scaffold protein SufB